MLVTEARLYPAIKREDPVLRVVLTSYGAGSLCKRCHCLIYGLSVC